jgi:putative Holliday junction resolvase
MGDSQRLMGLDVGSKTIGVAVSDLMGWTAQGVEVIRRRDLGRDLQRLHQLIDQYQVEAIVVGLPKNMNNTLGPQAEEVLVFKDELAKTVSQPIHLWDERLTTASAHRSLLEADVSRAKRKAVVDKIAATLILQGFMDRQSSQQKKD